MISEDILNLVFGVLSLIPLSFFIQYIPNLNLRKAYSLILGLIIQLVVFQSRMYPLYLQHLIAYAIIKIKRKKIGGIVTFQSIAFLSAYHIYEYLFNYGGWNMNASALLMILVCKYSLLAYNIDDGQTQETLLTPQQLKNRIQHDVSFLDYLGYLSFLPTSLMGPPIQYNDYKDFMQKNGVYAHIPSVVKKTCIVLLEMLLYVGIYIFGEIYVPLSVLRKEEFYHQSSPWYIFLYATVSTYLLRCKYYFGWKISMGAIHSSGVSYDGKSFDKINTINPWIFETSVHVREKISNWNMSVQQWLRKGIYERSSIKNRHLKQFYVFGVSAFWHGFYPAYYISFTFWFLHLHVQNLAFKYFKSGKPLLAKLYTKSGIVGKIILSNLVTLMWSHMATYFLVLQTTGCWLLMKNLYFVPQIILIGLALIFTFLPTPRQKQAAKKD